jgi:hypothetical protein
MINRQPIGFGGLNYVEASRFGLALRGVFDLGRVCECQGGKPRLARTSQLVETITRREAVSSPQPLPDSPLHSLAGVDMPSPAAGGGRW